MTLERRVGALTAAAVAARGIGLVEAADAADAVLGRMAERAGFPGEAYVLALAGGTGVGKSSVLNALAGHTVSTVRAVRPTTDEPVAWVAEERRAELAPLLTWLGVEHVAAHADEALGGVAILDLPDVDSVRTEHRALVDRLLPRIDAVAWVVDPEKYDDERLHGYLRTLAPHAGRMRFVLNKADRLTDEQRRAVATDLERRLAASGIDHPRIHVVSALTADGIDALRADLAGEADAKALVISKLATDVRVGGVALGAALAVHPGAEPVPLLPGPRRGAMTAEAVAGALAVVDLEGLARQVRAAVVARARRSGGSLLARVVTLLGWMTGQSRRRADPAGYLRDWRRRGTLARVVNPVRAGLLEASAGLPASSRRAVLGMLGTEDLERAAGAAIDGAVREASSDLRIPGSIFWPIVGVAQLLVGAVFLFAAAWYVTLFVAGGSVPVATVELSFVGPVPVPLLLLAGSILVSALLGWIVGIHAAWVGRRAGRRIGARVRGAVERVVTEEATAGVDGVEAARRAAAAALSVE